MGTDKGPHSPSRTGIIVATSRGEPVYSNPEARSVLTYPDPGESVPPAQTIDGPRLHALLSRVLADEKAQVVDLRSGRRQYSCRAFSLDPASRARARQVVLVTLERRSRASSEEAPDLIHRFGLSRREAETALLLVDGLTNKEIAERMQVAPNTVKAFLKLVMLKMHTFTRSGVVGKIVRP